MIFTSSFQQGKIDIEHINKCQKNSISFSLYLPQNDSQKVKELEIYKDVLKLLDKEHQDIYSTIDKDDQQQLHLKICQAIEILLDKWYYKNYGQKYEPSFIVCSQSNFQINCIIFGAIHNNLEHYSVLNAFEKYLDSLKCFGKCLSIHYFDMITQFQQGHEFHFKQYQKQLEVNQNGLSQVKMESLPMKEEYLLPKQKVQKKETKKSIQVQPKENKIDFRYTARFPDLFLLIKSLKGELDFQIDIQQENQNFPYILENKFL